MSNVAYKPNIEREHVHTRQPEPKKQILRRGKITLGEKMIIITAVVVIAFFAFKMVSVQASIYNVNKDIQTSEEKIVDQKKTNEDLKVQEKQLSSYDRVLDKAKKDGLKLDGDNVKVVDGK
ncbi:cell division protein FtsL [Listeria costaricensis]|uniref:cell division protein FtsL n=1 Tax=Listeria costaricensis TaxID=2026604 RepID=UPI000C08BF60|nr:cell division protein FtsL [Listeria costaricensis]